MQTHLLHIMDATQKQTNTQPNKQDTPVSSREASPAMGLPIGKFFFFRVHHGGAPHFLCGFTNVFSSREPPANLPFLGMPINICGSGDVMHPKVI